MKHTVTCVCGLTPAKHSYQEGACIPGFILENPYNGYVHIMPSAKDHVESTDCWCEPEMTFKDEFTLVEVWVHKGLQ